MCVATRLAQVVRLLFCAGHLWSLDTVASGSDGTPGVPFETGCVIVDGRHLEAPYRLRNRGAEVFVNEVKIARVDGGPEAPPQLLAALELALVDDLTIVAFDETARIVSNSYDVASLLSHLIATDSRDDRVVFALLHAYHGEPGTSRLPSAKWRAALARFRATEDVNRFVAEWNEEDTEEDSQQVADAPTDYSTTRMYSVTAAGMMMVAVAWGFLLQNVPKVGRRWSQVIPPSDETGSIVGLLCLILMFSTFDLCSTVFAATSANFVEVNPFGDSFLGKPWMLCLWKLSFTGAAVGILWRLRQYAGAQQASWWLCLVLTLVTVRWLLVQSLFFV